MPLRRFRRRRSVSVARMTVSRHVPWPARVALPVLLLLLGLSAGALAMRWVMLAERSDAQQLQARLEDEHERAEGLEAERDRLAAIVNAADGELKVEKTAAERLGAQVADMERENARLQADLAYLERLLPAAAGEGDVAIRGLQVEIEAPDGGMGVESAPARGDGAPPVERRLRYRALLTQSGRADRPFVGTLQLVLTTTAAGRPGSFSWPESGDAAARERAKVTFRRFQRVEGSLELPADVTIRSVQLRVLEAGAVRAQQTASP